VTGVSGARPNASTAKSLWLWAGPTAEGGRPHIGALLLAYYAPDGRLVYAGRAGTGLRMPSWGGLAKAAADRDRKDAVRRGVRVIVSAPGDMLISAFSDRPNLGLVQNQLHPSCWRSHQPMRKARMPDTQSPARCSSCGHVMEPAETTQCSMCKRPECFRCGEVQPPCMTYLE
jgi:hypothetical protein